MPRAYDKFFLEDVKKNLGFATDFAVNGCGVVPDDFFDFFIISKVAKGIEEGSPAFTCGTSGTELAITIFSRVGFYCKKNFFDDDSILINKSPEYWAGWILTYYQWTTGLSFSTIRNYSPLSQIIQMYHPLHEAPEEKFVKVMNRIIRKKNATSGTKLHQLRKAAGLTQKQLSELSGINLRTLQQYETGVKDINKAVGDSINALARALCCNFYDVMEVDLGE